MPSLRVAVVAILVLTSGCSSSGVGVRTIQDGAPDAWASTDLAVATQSPDTVSVTAADLQQAPDTLPVVPPDARQAPGVDLGNDTPVAVDSGVGDSSVADTEQRFDSSSPYIPDPRKCIPDPSFCASVPDDRLFGPADMGYCSANADYILVLDGGNRVLYRDNCPTRCKLCTP